MSRYDIVCENYENVTDNLFGDKTAFEDYLKFAGRFFKLPSVQSMVIYGTNPKATMVADFDTWKKFNRHVKRGTNSIAVLDNGGLKHYFDISQTNGSKTPYQWTLGKDTANALIDEVYEQSGMRFKSFSGCVNYLGAEQARETAENVMNTLNVSEENRAAFEKSYVSMTQYLIAARCELGSSFKYNGSLDLSALDMLHSKAEKERLCEFVQLAGKSVLLSLEKSINNIVMQERTVDYGRSKADMVRGGQDVLSRNQDGERQEVQARPDNVRVSGANGTRSDGGGAGTDERADRTMGREVAQANGGNAPRTDTVTSRTAAVGTDTPTDRPRSVGAAADAQNAVREEIPSPDRVGRVESVGEHIRSDSGQRDNGNGSAGSHRIDDEKQNERGTTYSTENTEQTAEDISPAVSLSEIADDILALDTAVKDSGSDVFVEDYFEEHTSNKRVHIMNMLTAQNYKPLRDYLDAVFREAYENHEMLNEGIKAQKILEQIDALGKSVSKDTPYVTVEPFSKVDFEKIGLDENRQYTIPEFNSALNEADRLYTADDEYEDRLDKFTVSLHIDGRTAQYNVLLGAEYGSLSAIMNSTDLVNTSNIDITLSEKQLVADIEKAAALTESRGSTIHFGLLGNGITCYDISRTVDGDYPTVAHISNEGNVKYYDENLSADDKRLIEEQAAQQKREFTESWNNLPIETRYERLLDEAGVHLTDITNGKRNSGLSMEEMVAKYEHSVIFKDEPFPVEKPNHIKDEDTIFDWSKYTALGAHSAFARIIREKNTAIDTDVKISLSPKSEDLSDYALEIGISPFAQGNELYYTIRYNLRNEKTDKITEVGAYFVDTDGVMIAGHSEHLPDYETFRTIVEANAAKAVDKIRELLKQEKVTVSPDDLRVGDFVRGYGAVWRITNIDGDFSIAFENTDKNDIRSVQSIIGHWKENFVKQGYEYVSPDEIRQTVDTTAEPVVEEDNGEEFEEIPDEPTNDYAYGEQLNLFGEPMHEVEAPEKTIIGGIDIEEALKRELIANGTGFVDGKFGVQQFYLEHKGDTKSYAKFLSDAYGVGGHSGEGKIHGVDYNMFGVRGIVMRIALDNGEETRVSWNWNKVANRIATLIDRQEYITQHDIDERISRAKREMAHNSEDSKEYRKAADILDSYGLLPEKEVVRQEQTSEIKAGDSFMYHGNVVTVTDDKGIYPDDIVITREDKVGGVAFAVTENVNIERFLREAKRITPERKEPEPTEEQAVKQERTETTAPERAEEPPVDIKNLAQLKRALTVGAEFEITSYIRDDVVNQWRRVKEADTVAIYSIRPDAPDDEKTTLANHGRGSYLPWEKASDWGFSNGICTAYRKGTEHTEENRLFSIKVRPRILTRERDTENRQTAEITNPLIRELAKTFPADTAERLYNAFEGAKMADWQSNQAKINRVKRALYDILGNEEQTESAFSVLSSGEAPKLKDIVIDLSPRTDRYEREEIPEQTRDGDMSEKLNKIAKTANTKIDYTITDENLGVGGAKEKFAANIAAIETLKRIESRNLHLAADMFKAHNADPDEQKILAGYVGWGGLSQAFDPNNKAWTKEYQRLKELLTDEEYAAAKGSTLNAHYTTPTVIGAIYKGLQNLGFEGGNILEPAMGVGNFFGAMPEELRQKSNLSGVELDSITGRIAQQLYQNADVQVKGFEKTDFSDNYFDAAVGNVPFGSYPVSDKRYNRENFFIHDYFLAKTLDKLAPGGVAALITTKGTLDKENPKVREYLARRADLIGAIRLPNTAFKANAGTEVTTDILFLQKREKMAVELPDWCYIAKDNNDVPVNQYFIDHPEMVLGTMKQGLEFSLYGNPNETACVPIEGADLKQQLEAAVANLKTNNAIRKHSEQRKAEAGVIAATADVRNFTFAEVDGKMYFRENNIMTEAADKNGNALTGKSLDRIRALNELRQTFRTILTAQENNCSDAQLETYQKILNAQYDALVKKYGYINDRANYQAFSKDDDYNSLCALEIINEETHEVTKSDFFSKRTVKQFTEITRVDTPQEALFVSVDTLGKLDIPYMAKLCEKEPDEVIEALKADNLIYLNPKKANPEKPYEGWEEASEYLSGNVRVKLRAAERAAEGNPELRRNVDALTAVIPQKLEAGDITARIGVHWVDVEDYQKFLQEYAKAHFTYGEPLRRAYNGEYKIPFKGRDYSKAATEIFGTKRMNSLEIFENLLNNRDVVVKDKKIDPDGKEHYEINKKETELAQDKASKMKEAFKRWLWEEPERREKYVTRYNELFNCIVGRKYDGSHQTFPGMSPSISLKPHQLDAVARAKFGGNTLLAHCVGAGKSFEMVAATMEKKRLGLINKACVVVPKALVGQMASEWLRLYPQAKILTATEKDFDKDHRQKFIGRCCTGDYDAVVMSYEQFEKIPMSFEYRRDFIQREINTLTSGIDDLKFNGGRNENSGSIKDMERVKKRLEARLEKLIEDNGKAKDTSLNFEQLGFDSIVVDEAHNYKNGLVVTKMQRVAGVQTTPAQKSEDILMKTQYLNENYGERNLLFATGTPVSNSMSELYIMQRYLRPSLLAQAGLQTFDDWASTFGEVVSKAEMKPAGNGYRTKKRFAKFNNLPELMAMYKEFADMRTAEMLDLPVPKIKGGKPETIVAEPNDFQKAYMKVLAERSEQVHSGAVDATKDNMLKITGEARLLGLDVRCLNPEAPNYPDSKVNLLIQKVMEIYTQTTPQKGVQAIFCDIAVHGDNEAEEVSEGGERKAKKQKSEKTEDGKFSVYNYIKAELIRRGIPADEICFAGDADTVKKQNEMKAQLRSGTKRIVLSSTSKLGTGANIQNKLVALHNLDIPWKPSDLEQRLGRIVRQGNENDEVGIYNYVTKDTFDAYMMNIIVTKQKFISQLNTTTSRSCEDVDDLVLNYSEIQAMAVGDERIKEKIELDMDVSRLKMLESEHYNEQYRLDDTIADAQKLMKNLTQNIAAAKKDFAFAQENSYLPENFKVEIGGKVYTDRKEAGTAIREAAVEFMANDNGSVRQPIGTFCGFELSVGKSHSSFGGATAEIVIRRGISYATDMDLTGDIGNATRLENLFSGGIVKKITNLEERAERTNADLQAALANKGKPFEHAEELAQKSARLEQLNLELEVGKVDEVIIADDEPEQGEPDRNEKHHEKDTPDNDRDKPTPPRHGGRR